jgi:transmembrane sensor
MTQATDIENQAALWLARRDAAGEGGELPAEFAAWLAADPRHRAAYLRLLAAWERSARLKRLRPEDSEIDPNLLKSARLSSQRSPSWSGWWPRIMTAAGVVTVAIVVAWWTDASHGPVYRTDIGGLSRVVLQDGSTVTLNTDTELRVHFTNARREVELRHGEANFIVAHNAARPFEVHVGERIVRAVGTAFDVRRDRGESIEVMVTEGRVAVLDAPIASSPTTIFAGESALATRDRVTVHRVSTTEASRQLSWQVGELSFEGEPLSQAVAEFNRYNRKKLRIDDPSIAELEIGGNFQALDVESFVAALGRSFNISAVEADDGTIVLARRPARN